MISRIALFLGCLVVATGLHAQTDDEKVIPTKESEPPFEVGQLANIAGYYIDLEEGMQLNFRMVGTKMRVYWIDADGLIIEPLSIEGNVRFRKTVSGKKLFQLSLVSNDAGLGHPNFIPYPHTFNLVLNVKDSKNGGYMTYPLRYNQAMSEPRAREE